MMRHTRTVGLVLLDPDLKLASMLAVSGTPANFLVDHQGLLLGGGVGYRDWTTSEAHRLITSLLKEGVSRKTKE